jgi:hypothetical protein
MYRSLEGILPSSKLKLTNRPRSLTTCFAGVPPSPGDVGTVTYESAPNENGNLYEVEFINAAGDTLAVVSLRKNAIQVVELQNVMLHLRAQAT